jgi:penicillin-binding protein 2
LGDTYNLSIGQGYLQVTPIQVAMSILPFANGGNLCKPSLIKDTPPQCKSLHLTKNELDIILEGMKEACSTGGTGYPFFDFKIKDGKIMVPISVACKTGTAESNAVSGTPHAWFTSFAPSDKPEISITVMVEDAGQGSDIAAPMAKELYKTYFERQN